MRILLFLLTFFFAAPVLAQINNVDLRAVADKSFKNKDYYEAAYYYRKLADGMNLSGDVELPYLGTLPASKKKNKSTDSQDYISYQLAESYRGYENYIEAEPWYYRVLSGSQASKYPLAKLWYGICLRANQRFDEAIRALEQFHTGFRGDKKYIDMAVKEIETCRFAKEQYQYPALTDVAKMKGQWNADGSNYALIEKDGKYWFTSSRLIKDDKKHLNRVYHLAANDRAAKPEMIMLKDNSNQKEVEYGTPTVSPDGKRMYYTRWYKEGSQIIHAIYLTNWSGGGWGDPQRLNSNVNAEGFNAIQPFVTDDGRRMFFVSNKPGGVGAYDIWVADLDDQGKPVNSTNLGTNINTAADEQAPWYDIRSKRLVYSSKGYTGLGGFDLFESFASGAEWLKPKNMGFPMNSAKDDLYYRPAGSGNRNFYVSSDRESDCCLDLFNVTDRSFILKGVVTDCETMKPLEGATVRYIDSLTKQTIKEVTLDKTATYTFDVSTRRPMQLVLEKKGYFTKVVRVSNLNKMNKDTLINDALCLQPFEVGKPIVIKNVLYDYDKANLRPESKLVLNDLVKLMTDNPKIKVELASHTDSVASDAYNDKLSQARAQACVDYIVSKGITTDRIFARGYGERKPIAPNSLPNGKDNPEGRQLNRRTEFTVLKTE